MSKGTSKVGTISGGYEFLVDPYVRRKVTALDVVNACDVLMNAGFNVEALSILARVMIPDRDVRMSVDAVEKRYG